MTKTNILAVVLSVAQFSAVSATCVTVPSEGTTAITGTPCSFPFEFDGQVFDACTTYDAYDGQPWCFTGEGTWGTCDCDGGIPCQTGDPTLSSYQPSAQQGEQCAFPFTFLGVSYDTCITDENGGTPWCVTQSGNWGDCVCDGGLGYGTYPEEDGFYECTTVAASYASAATGEYCSFPFEYKGVAYNDCTAEDNFGVPWCVTEGGSWGECACEFVSTKECTVTDSAYAWWVPEGLSPDDISIEGAACVFPFEYQNDTHYDCITTKDYPTPFCLTSTAEWGDCTCKGDTTQAPTRAPTKQPTPRPTKQPTKQPTTHQPTRQPTPFPTTPATPAEEEKAGGFDWGDQCSAGSGRFGLELPERFAKETVGDIPSGKEGVVVYLEAGEDLDVVLYDKGDTSRFPEGKAIVQYCSTSEKADPDKNCGLLGGSKEESVEYKGMTIAYSGYLGDQKGGKGNEYIKIVGTTSTTLSMGAYAYATGSAEVKYEWATSTSDCCKGVYRACGGQFSATVNKDALVAIGSIPTGKGDLRVELSSDVDVDVQLYDTDDQTTFREFGQAIVGYCSSAEKAAGNNCGLLGGPRAEDVEYAGLQYAYSGYDGDQKGGKGNEYIEIDGVTNRNLMMYFYGFKAGEASVTYSYTENTATAESA